MVGTISPPSLPGLTSQVGFTRLATLNAAELGQARVPVQSIFFAKVPCEADGPAGRVTSVGGRELRQNDRNALGSLGPSRERPPDRHRQAAGSTCSGSPEDILEPIRRCLRGGRLRQTLDHDETIDLAALIRVQEFRVVAE